MFFIGLSALIGVASSSPWRLTPQQAEFNRYLNTLRDDLKKDADSDTLADQAENNQTIGDDEPLGGGESA